MGWEARNGRGRYYTRSRRVGGRVVREYAGSGFLAQLAAALDAEERAERAARRAAFDAERARLASLDGPAAALCGTADVLAAGALLLAGYRRHHRGEWRLQRGHNSEDGRVESAGA